MRKSLFEEGFDKKLMGLWFLFGDIRFWRFRLFVFEAGDDEPAE